MRSNLLEIVKMLIKLSENYDEKDIIEGLYVLLKKWPLVGSDAKELKTVIEAYAKATDESDYFELLFKETEPQPEEMEGLYYEKTTTTSSYVEEEKRGIKGLFKRNR